MTTETGSVMPDATTTVAPADTTVTDTSAFAVEDGAPTGDATAVASAEDGEKKEVVVEGAPETYADFTMPEGVTLDSDMLAEFTPVLKELNLSQANAQRIMDFAPKLISNAVEGIKNQMIAEARDWHDASRKDSEIGGEKMAERLAVANKAFERFGTPALKTFLASKGLNAHPELIRAFYRAGLAIAEDKFVPGGKTVLPAKTFYDRSQMN